MSVFPVHPRMTAHGTVWEVHGPDEDRACLDDPNPTRIYFSSYSPAIACARARRLWDRYNAPDPETGLYPGELPERDDPDPMAGRGLFVLDIPRKEQRQ